MEEKSIHDLLSEKNDYINKLEECLGLIKGWCDAYPIDIFPEPDFKKVRAALEEKGIKIDAVSASNMRYLLNRIKKIIDEAAV